MNTAKILRSIEQASDTRQAIQTAVIAVADIIDVPTAVKVFQSHPEHGDLLAALPSTLQREVLEMVVKQLPSRVIEALLLAGSFKDPSPRLIKSVSERTKHSEKIILEVVVAWIKDGVEASQIAPHIIRHELILNELYKFSPAVALTHIGLYLSGLSSDEGVVRETIEMIEENELGSDLNLVPINILCEFKDSMAKAQSLLDRNAEAEAKTTFSRLLAAASRDEALEIQVSHLPVIVRLCSKQMAKTLLSASNVFDETGGILKLALFSAFGNEVISKADLIESLASVGSDLETRIALATSMGIKLIEIDRRELIVAALGESNLEIVGDILLRRRFDKESTEIKNKISKFISVHPKKAISTIFFEDEQFKDLMNEATLSSLNKPGGSLILLKYPHLSEETVKVIGRKIHKLLGSIEEIEGLISFAESYPHALGAEDLVAVRKMALGSLATTHELLTYSQDVEIRKKAVAKIKRSSKQSLEVLSDENVSLSESEVQALIHSLERRTTAIMALTRRVKACEIKREDLEESWREPVSKLLVSEMLNGTESSAKEGIQILATLSVETVESILTENTPVIEAMAEGKREDLEKILRSRSLLFSVVSKTIGIGALKKFYKEKEIAQALGSTRSISVAMALSAIANGITLEQETLATKLSFSSIKGLGELIGKLDKSAVSTIYFRAIDAVNKDSVENANELLKVLAEENLSIFKAHLSRIQVSPSYDVIESILRQHGGRECAIALLPILEEGVKIGVLKTMMAAGYSTDLAITALDLKRAGTEGIFSSLKWNAIKEVFSDPNLAQEDKDEVLGELSAETIQTMVQIYGPALEKRALSIAFAWPSDTVTDSQLEVLNNLGATKPDQKIRELFLDTVRSCEITLTEALLIGITDEDLYHDMIDVIDELMDSQDYVTEDFVEVLLNINKNPKPKALATYVAHFSKNWTKLPKEEQLIAIEYAVDNCLENFVIEQKRDGQISLRYASQIVGFVQEGDLYLVHSLQTLSSERKDSLTRIVDLSPSLPEVIVGSYHVFTGKFIADDKEVPTEQLQLEINVSEAALESLNQISHKVVLKDVKAIRRGSIVYDLMIDQQDILEMLAQSADVLREAQVIYNQIRQLKKNTLSLIEVMSAVDESEDRKFGVELEVASNIPREELAKRLGPNVTATDEYSSEMSWPKWTIKLDTSVQGGDFEAEIVSPILQGKDGIKELRQVMGKLAQVAKQRGIVLEVGEKTQTGLHVHHSIEDLVKKFGDIEEESEIAQSMAKYLMSVQGALYALCAKWRLANKYSRPIKTTQEISNEGGSRHGFAVTAYNTLEFRLKEATFNVSALVRWVVLTQQVTVSMIQRLNNELKESRTKLEQALDGGIDMILDQRLDEAGSLKEDILTHLAYYQAARNFAINSAAAA